MGDRCQHDLVGIGSAGIGDATFGGLVDDHGIVGLRGKRIESLAMACNA